MKSMEENLQGREKGITEGQLEKYLWNAIVMQGKSQSGWGKFDQK